MIGSRARSPTRKNPYVGPRPFREGDQLYGRGREKWEVADLLIAERIVLLHSPSGAGKTSLIQAAVIPELKDEGFRVTGPLRVNRLPPDDLTVANPYVWSAISEISLGDAEAAKEAGDGGEPPDFSASSRATLTEFLDRRDEEFHGRGRQEVLVFDQFEEILTLDPTAWDEQGGFFEDLGRALENTSRWVLLSMREDYMGGLARFAAAIPSRLAVRYRIDFLEHAAAMRATQKPAQDEDVEFTDEAAQSLVDDLARVSVQRPGREEPEPLPGPYVEPAQLQVVCYDLWRTLDKQHRGRFDRIDRADIEAFGERGKAKRQGSSSPFDYSLGRYYKRAVNEVAEETGADVRAIRDWFDEKLITKKGFRSQWATGPDVGDDVDVNEVLKGLRDRYLVRSDQRGSTVWHELAHDRLIHPVREENAYWRRKYLPPVELAALQWDKSHRDDDLLLEGPDLDSALKSMEGAPRVNPVVEDFLKKSVEKRNGKSVLVRYGQAISILVLVAVLQLVAIVVLLAILFF